MKLGLHTNRFTWPGNPEAMGPVLGSIARRAEAAGFDSMWVMDHLFQIPPNGPAEMEMNEAYTTLGFLAGVTSRLRLGTMVTGVTYRNPALLVKAVTTLDVLSGGRAYFGVGAAWFEREHTGLGFDLPPLAERFRRLEETLLIAKQMWSGEVGPFEGRYYRLAETLCSPPPIQKPHPPILIGGGGETKTLRLVARHADACNIFAHAGLDVMAHKLEVLKEHCRTEGRDYDTIERTANTRLDTSQSADQIVAQIAAIGRLGFSHVNCAIPTMHEDGVLERIGREVVPEVKKTLARLARSRRGALSRGRATRLRI